MCMSVYVHVHMNAGAHRDQKKLDSLELDFTCFLGTELRCSEKLYRLSPTGPSLQTRLLPLIVHQFWKNMLIDINICELCVKKIRRIFLHMASIYVTTTICHIFCSSLDLPNAELNRVVDIRSSSLPLHVELQYTEQPQAAHDADSVPMVEV